MTGERQSLKNSDKTDKESLPESRSEVVVIGPDPADQETVAKADDLVSGIVVVLQEFDTETLLAIADFRDTIRPDGWMQSLIREYVEVWR